MCTLNIMYQLNRTGFGLLQTIFIVLLIIKSIISSNKSNAFISTVPGYPGAVLSFIENKGQWIEEARFKAEIPGGAVFITDKGFVYNFQSSEDMECIHKLTCAKTAERLPEADGSKGYIRHHAYRVNFAGADPSGDYVREGKRSYYYNYFIGSDRARWAGRVGLFEKVVQRNVYKGIDVAIYSVGTALKYDFIVAEGADPGQIVLDFEGVQPQLTPEGHLKIKTSVNEVTEQSPYVYQVVNGQIITVPSRYKLSKGQLTFEFPQGYHPDYVLVIDPVLVFCTHSGRTGSQALANATTHDKAGNLYAGALLSDVGWPTTTGAYQEKPSALADVGINKYNATGTALLYSTYYGGWDADNVHAMIVNDNDELIIAGHTTSTNLPTTTGCYDSTYNGAADIFVARFGQGGDQLLAATYIGGSNLDGEDITSSRSFSDVPEVISPLEIAISATGDTWVVSRTNSNDFPVTANAFQTRNGGEYDGIVFSLNTNCSRLIYSSYIGGSGNDGCFNAVINSEGNIVMCGNTQSDNFPATAGVLHGMAPGGSWDGFVAIVNTQTGALMQSTYLGTPEMDKAFRLQVDAEDNVFVLGTTQGDYPIAPNVYHMPGTTMFIDKLSPTLTRSLLSTRFGNAAGRGLMTPSAFLYDICGNVYVTVFNAQNNMPVTEDAYETAPRSFWFCVFKPAFTDLHYASYFGSTQGDHAEYGIHRFDRQGIVYQAICTNNANFPTTPNAVFPSKKNTGVDNLSFKFDFQIPIVNSRFELLPELSDSGCAPYTVQFVNTSRFADQFTWDFGDGSPLFHDRNATHTFDSPGLYKVALYAQNDTTCNRYDTAYTTIVVLKRPEIEISVRDITLCNFDQQVSIGVNINSSGAKQSIQWGPSEGIVGHDNTASITVNPFVNNV